VEEAEPAEATEAAPTAPNGPPAGLDEVAESEFRAEARSRGETIRPVAATAEVAEESDTKALPPLNELVNRIPPEVREALDDLFRAKFIAVKRVPKNALKIP